MGPPHRPYHRAYDRAASFAPSVTNGPETMVQREWSRDNGPEMMVQRQWSRENGPEAMVQILDHCRSLENLVEEEGQPPRAGASGGCVRVHRRQARTAVRRREACSEQARSWRGIARTIRAEPLGPNGARQRSSRSALRNRGRGRGVSAGVRGRVFRASPLTKPPQDFPLLLLLFPLPPQPKP